MFVLTMVASFIARESRPTDLKTAKKFWLACLADDPAYAKIFPGSGGKIVNFTPALIFHAGELTLKRDVRHGSKAFSVIEPCSERKISFMSEEQSDAVRKKAGAALKSMGL